MAHSKHQWTQGPASALHATSCSTAHTYSSPATIATPKPSGCGRQWQAVTASHFSVNSWLLQQHTPHATVLLTNNNAFRTNHGCAWPCIKHKVHAVAAGGGSSGSRKSQQQQLMRRSLQEPLLRAQHSAFKHQASQGPYAGLVAQRLPPSRKPASPCLTIHGWSTPATRDNC